MNKRVLGQKNNDCILTAMVVFALFTSFLLYIFNNKYITIYSNAILVLLFFILLGRIIVKYKKGEDLNIDKKDISLLFQLIIPYIIYYLYSLILIIVSDKSIEYLIIHSTISIGMTIIVILIAFLLNILYQNQGIKMINLSFIGANVAVLLYFIITCLLTGKINLSILEVHELTYIIGLLLLFNVINGTNKFNKINILLLLFLIIGGKRITNLSLIICLVGYLLYVLLLKKFNSKKNILIFTSLILIFVFSYLLISTHYLDYFLQFLEYLGVNTMGRNQIYLWFKDFYSGLNLFGQGIYFTNYAISMSPLMSCYKAIHNDILRIFIEGGLIFFIIYFINFIALQTKRLLNNYDLKVASTYIFLILFTIFHYTTDNVFVYIRYILVFNFLIFYISKTRKNLT